MTDSDIVAMGDDEEELSPRVFNLETACRWIRARLMALELAVFERTFEEGSLDCRAKALEKHLFRNYDIQNVALVTRVKNLDRAVFGAGRL